MFCEDIGCLTRRMRDITLDLSAQRDDTVRLECSLTPQQSPTPLLLVNPKLFELLMLPVLSLTVNSMERSSRVRRS